MLGPRDLQPDWSSKASVARSTKWINYTHQLSPIKRARASLCHPMSNSLENEVQMKLIFLGVSKRAQRVCQICGVCWSGWLVLFSLDDIKYLMNSVGLFWMHSSWLVMVVLCGQCDCPCFCLDEAKNSGVYQHFFFLFLKKKLTHYLFIFTIIIITKVQRFARVRDWHLALHHNGIAVILWEKCICWVNKNITLFKKMLEMQQNIPRSQQVAVGR